MSLYKYRIYFSNLSVEEKDCFIKKIDSISFNGLQWDFEHQTAVFFVENTAYIESLKIPYYCNLYKY